MPLVIHAGLAFAAVIPVALIVGSLWFAVSLCKAARRGDKRFDAQCRSRVGEPGAGYVVGYAPACHARVHGDEVLAHKLSSKRGRGADTPDRTTGKEPR